MRIRKVTWLHLDHPVPVFDLSVPGTENFALAAGPFVHNSKDCADALAGVLWTLSQQQLTTPLPILRQSATGGDSWMTDQYQGQAGGGPAGAGAEKWEPLPFFRGSSTGGRG